MNNSQFPTDHTESGGALRVARAPPTAGQTPRHSAPGLFNNSSSINHTPRHNAAENAQAYSPCDDTHDRRGGLPMMTTRSTSGTSALESTPDGTLLQVVLPVVARIGDKEEAHQTLGITVRNVASSPHSSARVLCIRVTDPSDPFLLFELEIREEDYASFRQRLELRVDFFAFPKYLVSLLQDIANDNSPCHVSFMVGSQDSAKGVLRILEATEFKTVEHVSLLLLRQGDVGQKKYLAERFQFFERAHQQSARDCEQQRRLFEDRVRDLEQSIAELTKENGHLRDDMKVSKSVSEKNYVAAMAETREAHADELQQVRERLLKEMRELRDEANRTQTRLTDDVRNKDEELRHLRESHRVLESTQVSLRSKLSLAQDKLDTLTAELKSVRESNTELTHFKLESTRAMSENELNYVSVTERLRAATAALKDKEEELHSLRQHYQKQDDYIRILTTQNDQMQERCATNDKSLDKAHHIIAHQLETIKNLKERYRIASDQIASKEALLSERQLASERMKDELSAAVDRAHSLQQKNNDLKEQLQRTDAAQEKLSQELKQSQTALLHLQRSTSVNGRHWGVFSSSTAPSPTGVAPSLSPTAASGGGIYSQFARHATMHGTYGSTHAAPTTTSSTAATAAPVADAVPTGDPAVTLFRSTQGGGSRGGLTSTTPQTVLPKTNSAADGGLTARTAESANRIASSTLGGKDALRAKTFFADENRAGLETQSAYF